MDTASELHKTARIFPQSGTERASQPDKTAELAIVSGNLSSAAETHNTPEHTAVTPNPAAVYKPVRVLDPETARKIAAGEVIDRPAAVIRELLDNAIDAGASRIQVEITGGGISRIRVTDNGTGMSKEDLALCTDTHTTSKISTAEDLLSLHSLGFRGEALSSIKAVSDLEITSTRSGPAAWKLQMGNILPARLPAGTAVQVENLFQNFPARKQFLKRAAAETALCRTIFLDKALPHYTTEMRFITDGTLRFLLPPAHSLRERCLAAFSFKEPETLFFEIEGSGEHYSFRIVLGSPDVVRSDKRAILIFVNGRRIVEFGLTQAIEYGSEGYFPNGGHPVAFLFLTVAPSRVDFNIHPAKKEARFQDYNAIHHAVSSTVSSFYRQHTVASLLKEKHTLELTRPFDFQHSASEELPVETGQEKTDNTNLTRSGNGGLDCIAAEGDNSNRDSFLQDALRTEAASYSAWSEQSRLYTESLAQKHGKLKGSAFRQIAATPAVPYSASGHIIPPPAAPGKNSTADTPFDTIPYNTASGTASASDIPATSDTASCMLPRSELPRTDFKLLGQVAGTFIAVEKHDSLYLIDQHAAHERIIFEQLRHNIGGVQELLIPYRIITASEADDSFIREHQELLCRAGFDISDEGAGVWQVTAVPARWTGTERDLIQDLTGVRKNTEDILYRILASAACRAACKDHAILDPVTQQHIATQAFNLPEPICPHGRPIWIILTREELFKRVKRTR